MRLALEWMATVAWCTALLVSAYYPELTWLVAPLLLPGLVILARDFWKA